MRVFSGRNLPANIVFNEAFSENIECPCVDCGADTGHEVQIEMQIVQGNQPQAENFLGLDEMPEIAAGELTAGVARAALLDRALLHDERGVF